MSLCFNSPTYTFLTDTMLTGRQVKWHICVEAYWTLDDILHNIRCKTIIPGSHNPEYEHKFDPLDSSSIRSFLCLVHLPLIKLNIIHEFYGQCHAYSQVHQHEQCPLFEMLHTESEFKSGLIIEQSLLLHSRFDDFCHKAWKQSKN